MTQKQIYKLFEDFSQFKVVIIGDVMIDSYMWGRVDRISPEAPVPILSSTKRENRLGGAANVAMNIKSLGAKPVLCSMIGDDDKGKLFLKLMEKRGLTTKGIISDNDRMTTTKTRVISGNQHLLRVDQEKTNSLTAKQEAIFCNNLQSIIHNKDIDAVVFEDYDKGTITPSVINFVVEEAKKHDIPTLVDPKKHNFMHYHNITLFKPNFKEMLEGLKLEFPKNDFQSLFEASKMLHKKNMKYIFTTLSELGVFISTNETYYSVPAEIRDIADVSGAGDTVISTAALCLAAGLSALSIAEISNLAGGLVCEKVGVVPIDKKLLIEECIEKCIVAEQLNL